MRVRKTDRATQQSLPFQKVKHEYGPPDAQPTATGGIIILVTGQLIVSDICKRCSTRLLPSNIPDRSMTSSALLATPRLSSSPRTPLASGLSSTTFSSLSFSRRQMMHGKRCFDYLKRWKNTNEIKEMSKRRDCCVCVHD